MQTTNTAITIAATDNTSSYGTAKITPAWVGRGLIVAAVAALCATALALGYHWIAAADLLTLLYVLPGAAMMLMCMKGHHGRATRGAPASGPDRAPNITEARN